MAFPNEPERGGVLPADGPWPLMLHDHGGCVPPKHIADQLRALAPAAGTPGAIDVRLHPEGSLLGPLDLLARKPR
jgi:hypothetical protein